MLKRLSLVALLCLLALPALAFWQSRDSNYNISSAPSVVGMFTPIFSAVALPASGTATEFGGVQTSSLSSGLSGVATARFTPLPIPGTLSHLNTSLGDAQAAGPFITDQLNGVLGTVTCAWASSACSDSTHSDHAAAGTLMQWVFNANSVAWSQAGALPFSPVSFLYQGDNAQEGMILSSPTATGSTVTAYLHPGGGFLTPTAITANGLLSAAGQITSIFAYPNGPDNGTNQHQYIVFKNGAATTLTCTASAVNPTLGCCATVTATPENVGGNPLAPCTTGMTPISFAVGDTLEIQVLCSGTCASVAPGVGLGWTPTITNQVPLFATVTISASPFFVGVSDYTQTTTTHISWENVPASMNFGGLMICQPFVVTSGTWSAALQSGATPGTTPTTIGAGGPAVTYGTGSACPGSGGGGAYVSGAQDSSGNHFSAIAGNTVDTTLTNGGGSGGAGQFKIGMWVTVP